MRKREYYVLIINARGGSNLLGSIARQIISLHGMFFGLWLTVIYPVEFQHIKINRACLQGQFANSKQKELLSFNGKIIRVPNTVGIIPMRRTVKDIIAGDSHSQVGDLKRSSQTVVQTAGHALNARITRPDKTTISAPMPARVE